MTGGEDVLTARYLFSEFFDFVPTFKLWLATNHKPLIRGTDPAIWDRIKLIPFNRRFEESEKDKELPKRLKLELPGILNWVIEGCRDWQQNGLGVPAVVSDATKEYRDEMDFLAEFIADQCVVGPKCEAGATALYDRYRIWAQVNREEPISQTKLGRQLQNRGFGSGKDAKGCKTRIGIGICAKGNVSPDSYGGTSGSSREDFDSTGS
jgi:putative DNA primase/helicase